MVQLITSKHVNKYFTMKPLKNLWTTTYILSKQENAQSIRYLTSTQQILT